MWFLVVIREAEKEEDVNMKNIVIYGAPAAGKGTQCEMLIADYGYNHISTGQLFRELDDSTEFNRKIKRKITEGILIDDETTAQLLKNKLDSLGAGKVIIDGFPRNLNQAKILDEFLEDYVVINLEVTEQMALSRALGRLNCPKCGKIYNKYSEEMKPKKEGYCDNCNVLLEGRSDDTEEGFKTRFHIYLDNVNGLLDYYKKKGILYTVVSEESKFDTNKNVKKVIEGE